MPARYPCPYIGASVELTAERQLRIESKHPEMLPGRFEWMVESLTNPEMVLQSRTSVRARLFVRRYHANERRRFTVVVVVTDATTPPRNWIITADLSRDLPKGIIEWQRS